MTRCKLFPSLDCTTLPLCIEGGCGREKRLQEAFQYTPKPHVSGKLMELGKLYADRNAIYGDDYKRHGDIMTAFFPEGMQLETAADFNRYAIFQQLVTKLNRYAANFAKGGHHDSLDDISIYAQMLQELDAEWRELHTVASTLDQEHTS